VKHPTHIPAFIDHIAVLRDLTQWGWRDYKLEAACGFSVGYIAKLREQPNQRMFYPSAARLYNLWCDELTRRSDVPHGTSRTSNYEPVHSFSLTALSA
jgi:hypothetical protein